jgi:hypothetical protein
MSATILGISAFSHGSAAALVVDDFDCLCPNYLLYWQEL